MHVLIAGGGIIGLSLAWQLVRQGAQVTVLEQGQPGSEASWAGAGIVPAARATKDASPEQRLAALSYRLHHEWAALLRQETGIDTGFHVCGGLYVAVAEEELPGLRQLLDHCRHQGLQAQWLSQEELARAEPALFPPGQSTGNVLAAVYVPEDVQLRNPWHLRALLSVCLQQGVHLLRGTPLLEVSETSGGTVCVQTPQGKLEGDCLCLCTGAWSGAVAERLGCRLPVEPVRGQIALLRLPRREFQPVVNLGPRYLVPRTDGRVLVGSTEERAGFDKRTTSQAVASLLEMAARLVPSLARAEVERCWAGLRPCTPDRRPCLGPVPGWRRVFVATGHFRGGVTLSPGTAQVMAELLLGRPPAVELEPFRVDRFGSSD